MLRPWTYIIRVLRALAMWLLPLLAMSTEASAQRLLTLNDSAADLGAWDPLQDGPIELRGRIRLYWQTWLSQTQGEASILSNFPGDWTADTDLPHYGFGTYQIRFRLQEERQVLLVWPFTRDAARLWLDGKLIAAQGELGTNGELIKPSPYTSLEAMVVLTPGEHRLELEFASTALYLQAQDSGLIMGHPRDIAKIKAHKIAAILVLIITFSVLGFYHLLLYILRPSLREALYFCGFCCFGALYNVGVSDAFLGHFFSPSPQLIYFFQSNFSPAIACLILFLREMFRCRGLVNDPRVLMAIAFTMPLSNLIVRDEYAAYYGYGLVLMYAVELALVFSKVWQKRRQKQRGTYPFLGSIFLFLAGIGHQILLLERHIEGPSLANWVALSFLATQVYLLLSRFTQAFRDQEIYLVRLAEQEKLRTQFFHNTSHELRTPLNGILGFIELVRKGQYGSIPEAAEQKLSRAFNLAKGLKLQVDTILDLAKSRRGDLQLVRQAMDLRELLEKADTLAEGLLLRSTRTTYVSKSKGLDHNFIGDSEKIFTIIRNLLGNAFKFIDTTRPNHIELMLTCEHGQLTIQVKDSGIGIPTGMHQKIFEEFSQVEGDARRSYEGTGLGLSLVKTLCELMQAKIALDSQPGQGSCFRVSIHSAQNADFLKTNDTTHPESALESASPAGKGNYLIIDRLPKLSLGRAEGAKVLVIDDNSSNCELIVGILEGYRYQLDYALSGSDGLGKMRRDKPDLLLLDMMMPQMSGEDVIAAMKQDPGLQDIPIILITARASDEDKLLGLSLGVEDYLPKPISSLELSLKVRNIVERHRLLRGQERSEANERFAQLGLLFADLSHELKNIIHGASSMSKLSFEDVCLALSVIELSDQDIRLLGKALISPLQRKHAMSRIKSLEVPNQHPASSILKRLRYSLAELDLGEDVVNLLWQKIAARPELELRFLEVQTRVFIQHHLLVEQIIRCDGMTQSVLAFSRQDDKEKQASLASCWDTALELISQRSRRSGVSWQGSVQDILLAIAPSHLIQILVNLALNALDAVEALPEKERWAKIEVKSDQDDVLLAMSNGGPPIGAELQVRLFERGFSTKGAKGTGLGLAFCQRVIRQAAGEIHYDTSSPHPRFVLHLKNCSVSASSPRRTEVG